MKVEVKPANFSGLIKYLETVKDILIKIRDESLKRDMEKVKNLQDIYNKLKEYKDALEKDQNKTTD